MVPTPATVALVQFSVSLLLEVAAILVQQLRTVAPGPVPLTYHPPVLEPLVRGITEEMGLK
jgi:hypothetical protein